MIRLNLPREPYWLDMPSGIKVLVRPLTTAVNETAKARMRRRAREVGEHRRGVEAAGGRVVDLPDLADADGVIGVGFALYAEALAVCGVIGWEGVGDDDGAPLDVTPDAVTQWMASYPGDADAFVVAYTRPINQAIAEGNGSRPSPNGTSAAAANTAKGAGTTGTPARKASRSKDASARTSNEAR